MHVPGSEADETFVIVGERSNLTLSTLELAKAWGDAGLGHKNEDMKKPVVSSSVSVFL